ncbi:Hypothetical Protein SLY_0508 [Strawberry lethal yellows phytoplasma (CPA) str. NZSb11]|uniref:Uncharacterized protein n=1 Tax=Strawberry lethal yellows phytoplasma (CPA) str. NZSb11 TaxID=980422 RepID=R4RX41_PHYAS|nr:Hypothetical Protein SLY_0508 [Strawberry lethal yellows phytoplasma (CPA) str. NZSb11]
MKNNKKNYFLLYFIILLKKMYSKITSLFLGLIFGLLLREKNKKRLKRVNFFLNL